MRSLLSSSSNLVSQILFLLVFGALVLGLREVKSPPPRESLRCHSNKVLLETLKASIVASRPCCFQKLRILALLLASSVIISRKRITRSQVLIKPLVPLNLLNILIVRPSG